MQLFQVQIPDPQSLCQGHAKLLSIAATSPSLMAPKAAFLRFRVQGLRAQGLGFSCFYLFLACGGWAVSGRVESELYSSGEGLQESGRQGFRVYGVECRSLKFRVALF